jgi:hypothetical protein
LEAEYYIYHSSVSYFSQLVFFDRRKNTLSATKPPNYYGGFA